MQRSSSRYARRGLRPRCAAGFTLMELLVVVLIIGLLTGIVAPRFLAQINRSETTAAKAQIDSFDKALQAFRIDMGHFPSTEEGLQALLAAPAGQNRWHGPYLKDAVPLDHRISVPNPPSACTPFLKIT